MVQQIQTLNIHLNIYLNVFQLIKNINIIFQNIFIFNIYIN